MSFTMDPEIRIQRKHTKNLNAGNINDRLDERYDQIRHKPAQTGTNRHKAAQSCAVNTFGKHFALDLPDVGIAAKQPINICHTYAPVEILQIVS